MCQSARFNDLSNTQHEKARISAFFSAFFSQFFDFVFYISQNLSYIKKKHPEHVQSIMLFIPVDGILIMLRQCTLRDMIVVWGLIDSCLQWVMCVWAGGWWAGERRWWWCWRDTWRLHHGLLLMLAASHLSLQCSVVKSRLLCYFLESRSICLKFYFLESKSSFKIFYFLEIK